MVDLYGDLAMDSCAQFLAVAEHRLLPARARSVGHQLRKAVYHSVWAPACQDSVPGGHAGVGVVSLGGAHLALPSFVTSEFREFFKLGRVLRTTLPTGKGGVVHLFVVYGYQGAEEDAEKLRLTDRLLQAVLAEARVVGVGQPMLIAGILMLILWSYLVWLRVFLLVGMLIWPLPILWVLDSLLILLVLLIGWMVLVLVEISLWAVPMPSLLPRRVMLLTGGSFLTFLFLIAFVLMHGWLMFLARLLVSPSGLLAGWTLLIGLLRLPLVLFRMSVIFIGMCLELFLMRLFVP